MQPFHSLSSVAYFSTTNHLKTGMDHLGTVSRTRRTAISALFVFALAMGGVTGLGTGLVASVTPAGATSTTPITRAATFPRETGSRGDSSITISPKAGDLVVFAVFAHSKFTVTAVEGGDVGTWQRAVKYKNYTTDLTAGVLHFEVWWGIATSTGSSTVRLSYASTVSQKVIEILADSFVSASSGWSLVAAGGSSNYTSPWVTWPTLTSNLTAAQLYWGMSEEFSSGTSTPTPGFTSTLARYGGNCFLYDGHLAPETAYAPLCGDTPPDPSTAVGVIFAAG